MSGSDYVPATQPGEKPGLTAGLPGWVGPGSGQTASSGSGGSSTTPPLPPTFMLPGSSWQGQPPLLWPPSTFTGPNNPWGPYLNPPTPSSGGNCSNGGNCPPGGK